MVWLIVFFIFLSCLSSVFGGIGFYYFSQNEEQQKNLPFISEIRKNLGLTTAVVPSPLPVAANYKLPLDVAKVPESKEKINEEKFDSLKESGEINGNVLVKNKICIKDWCISKDNTNLLIRQKNSNGGDNTGSFLLSNDGNVYIVNTFKKNWVTDTALEANNVLNQYKDKMVKFEEGQYFIKSKGRDKYIQRDGDGSIKSSGLEKSDWERVTFQTSTDSNWGF